VRVRLNMTTEPELLRIPWEFLRRNGKDLASQRDCTIVRELVTAEPARPYLVEGKIRMLGVIANPRRDLDVEGEKRRVTEALEKCNDQVELEWLEDCTFKSLQRKLQDTYHILHFVGHSAFTDDGDSIILLTDENGMAKEQSADSVAQLIGRQNSLQLVVFNSCDGARTKLDDPFASIATMLVQQGESAVIAMQFEISDRAAKAFAEELYFCLIDRRYPIDAAVAEARIAMLDVNQIEFATPVLFLRPGFVDLFNFEAPPVTAAPAVDAPPTAPVTALAAVGLPPPSPPHGAPPAIGTPPRSSKSKRWMFVAGAGIAAAVAGVVAVVTLSSGGDKADVATTPPNVESESPVPTTISGDSYRTILNCIESDLFLAPYFDANSPTCPTRESANAMRRASSWRRTASMVSRSMRPSSID
jgi:CHAT domain